MGSIQPASTNEWNFVIEIVLSKPAHTDVLVSKSEVPHPLEAGFIKHVGDDAGQIANYRLPLTDGRELHVKEYNEDYSTHWDHSSAIQNPLGHLLRDAPGWVFGIFTLIVVGAVILGFWLGSKWKSQALPKT